MNKFEKKIIFCELCCFKKIVLCEEDLISFIEIKSSEIQANIPKIIADDKNPIIKNKVQTKKFKCPKCGRGVILKNIHKAYDSSLKNAEVLKDKEIQELDKKKRIEDGKPHEKPKFES